MMLSKGTKGNFVSEQIAREQFDVLYLHGFASSPTSSKAQSFKNALANVGVNVDVPDLNFPSFKEMTLTSQLEMVEKQIAKNDSSSPLVMIGSSMGGLLASILSKRNKRTAALILLAPGFGITRRWKEFVTQEQYDLWKSSGEMHFFHHSHNCEMPLGYQFAQDLEQIQTEDILVDHPCLVFHGENDRTVPIETSRKFAEQNKHVDLRVLDDDHQLLASVEHMIDESFKFLREQRLLTHS